MTSSLPHAPEGFDMDDTHDNGRPEPAAIVTAQDFLRPHLHNPEVYWPTLVLLFEERIWLVDSRHTPSCTSAECLICGLIRDLNAVSAAHDLIQPSGCACPDHITHPTTPTGTDVTSNPKATA
ncbi:hypothetical protein [Couchioplanes caeruleus]|uniref:Uncharacterized protein n=2 Tax=Couchioplanes caeruleus TaxID=56438 RepID=A0A1K0FC36_9ACTN|nr:hypothetical protein [Couchioplanes caeruleus]OJF10393.1 hypothetical protein BG844_32170 [Couchioplanes caeruleus subsp. caeruleus]ROP29779.1 hypothetical protein EDD30_2594 [Couchioplanes caeruleus]